MGYPVIDIEGTVTSWSNAPADTFNAVLLSKISPATARLRAGQAPADVTPLNTAVRRIIPGLAAWGGTISGRAFASPRLGNQGLATFSAGGYVLHLDALAVRIRAAEYDITEMNATPPLWSRFCPGNSMWSATIRCMVDSATAVVLPTLSSATTGDVSLPTVTLQYGTGSDATLAGTAQIVSTEVGITRGDRTMVEFGLEGDGVLAAAGAGSIFGTYSFGRPGWDAGSSAPTATTDPKLVVTAASGRTYTGCAFWNSIDLTWDVRSPVVVSIGVRGTGPWLPA